ncbi:T9SS type A sorting domain-containing protein [Puteibacter caeruleilacunae]|nr:T9SS type A sorting domain-containing protein [Puteibacter caeruleilacunae]
MRKSFTRLFSVCMFVCVMLLGMSTAWAQPGDPTQHNTTLMGKTVCFNADNMYTVDITLNDLYKVTGFKLYVEYNHNKFDFDGFVNAAPGADAAFGDNDIVANEVSPGRIELTWDWSNTAPHSNFEDVVTMGHLKFSLEDFPYSGDFPVHAQLMWDEDDSEFYLEAGEPALNPKWGKDDMTVDILLETPQVSTVAADCSYESGAIRIDNFDPTCRYVINGDIINGPFFDEDLITVVEPGSENVVIAIKNDAPHCLSAPARITVEAPQPLTVSYEAEDKPCDPDRFVLHLTGHGGSGDYTFYVAPIWDQFWQHNYYGVDDVPGLHINNTGQFDLPEGTYWIWVEDSNGCSSVFIDLNEHDSYYYHDLHMIHHMNDTPALVFDDISKTPQDNCGSKGSVSFDVEGGTPMDFGGYQVAILPVGSTASKMWKTTDEYGEYTFNGLSAGNYILYARDKNFCMIERQITIDGYGFEITDVDYTDATECEESPEYDWDGTITLQSNQVNVIGAGFTGDLEYTITEALENPGTVPVTWKDLGETFEGLAPGHYAVFVREVGTSCWTQYMDNGLPKFVPIMSPSQIEFDWEFYKKGTSDLAYRSGRYIYACHCIDIYVDVDESTTLGHGYTVELLEDGSPAGISFNTSTKRFPCVPAGTYTVVVTDEEGTCPKEESVTIMDTDLEGIEELAVKQPTCFEGTDGKFSFAVVGGMGNLSFYLDYVPVTLSMQDGYYTVSSSSGEHYLKVVDETGCAVDFTFNVPFIDQPTLHIDNIHIDCYGSTVDLRPSDFEITNHDVPDPSGDYPGDDQFQDPHHGYWRWNQHEVMLMKSEVRYGPTPDWDSMEEFQINFPYYHEDETELPAGEYYFAVMNYYGCIIYSNKVTITQNRPFEVSVVSTVDPICPGSPGKVTFRIEGGDIRDNDGGDWWLPFRFVFANQEASMDNYFDGLGYWSDDFNSDYHYVHKPWNYNLHHYWSTQGYIEFTFDLEPGSYFFGFEDQCRYNNNRHTSHWDPMERLVVPVTINDQVEVKFNTDLIEDGITHPTCYSCNGSFELLDGAVENSTIDKLYKVVYDEYPNGVLPAPPNGYGYGHLQEISFSGGTASGLCPGHYVLWSKTHEDCVGCFTTFEILPAAPLEISEFYKLRDALCFGEEGVLRVQVQNGWGNYKIILINDDGEESEHVLPIEEHSHWEYTFNPETYWHGSLAEKLPYFCGKTVPVRKYYYTKTYDIRAYANEGYTIRVEDAYGNSVCVEEWDHYPVPVCEPDQLDVFAVELGTPNWKTSTNRMINIDCADDANKEFELVFHGGWPSENVCEDAPETDELEWRWVGQTSWSQFSKSSTDPIKILTSRPAGDWDVELRRTEHTDCVVRVTIEVKDAEGIEFDTEIKHVSCRHGSDGEIKVFNTTGGVGNYWFQLVGVNDVFDDTPPSVPGHQWVRTSSSATAHTFTGLPYGHYNVYVRDGNGCVVGKGVQVDQPETYPMIDGFEVLKYASCENNDGEVKVIAHGGTGDLDYFTGLSTSATNFDYQFPNPAEFPQQTAWQEGDTFTGLGYGTHILWIIDENGCVSGGEIDFLGDPDGIYTEFELDNHRVPMPAPDPITFDVGKIDHADCYGEQGSLLVYNVQGGSPGLSTFWYEVQGIDNDFHDIVSNPRIYLNAGWYKVRVVEDANGKCPSAWRGNYQIKQPAEWDVVPHIYNLDACATDETGTIEIEVLDGPFNYYDNLGMDPVYRYTIKRENWSSFLVWDEAFSFKVDRNAVPVDYEFKVGLFFQNGEGYNDTPICMYEGTVTIMPGNTVTIDMVKDVTCHGDPMSSARITASGDQSNSFFYRYVNSNDMSDLNGPGATGWMPFDGDEVIPNAFNHGDVEGDEEGHYWFQVKDELDCISDPEFITFNVVSDPISVAIEADKTECTEDLTITVSGGALSYDSGIDRYIVRVIGEGYDETMTTDDVAVFVGLARGVYEIHVTDTHECMEEFMHTVVGMPVEEDMTMHVLQGTSAMLMGNTYAAGPHTVLYTPEGGCERTYNLVVIDDLMLSVDVVDAECDGTVTAMVSEAAGDEASHDYWFSITADDATEPGTLQASGTFNNVAIGSYLMWVKDADHDSMISVPFVVTGNPVVNDVTTYVFAGGMVTGPDGEDYGVAAEAHVVKYMVEGCERTTNLTVMELPAPEITADGDVLTASAYTVDVTYQWYKDGEMVDGATGMTLEDAMTGNYTVMVTEVENSSSATSAAYAHDSTPMPLSYSPTSGSTTSDAHPAVTATFNEPIMVGSGTIKIIPVGSTDPAVTVTITADMIDGHVVTPDWDTSTQWLDKFTEYYVLVDAGAITDANGNPFPGIDDPDAWKFTTGDVVTDVDQLDALEYTIYPNPFDNEINLSSNEKISRVVISNIAGQVVKQVVNPSMTIQTGELGTGVYFITLFNDANKVVKTERVVKR